jgi:hypothetical protein
MQVISVHYDIMNLGEAEERYGLELARQVVEAWEVMLHDLQQSAQRRAATALAGVFLRADAHALADLLSKQPLEDAKAAAAAFQLTVDQAAAVLKDAQESCDTRRLSPTRALEADGVTAAPTDEDLEAARREVWEAKKAAFDSRIHLNQLEAKIAALRKTTGPDERDLSLLAAALDGMGRNG